MAAILRDFRYSLRTLRKSPVFLAVAVLSLALGIGANTAIFTLIYQLILQPLPVRDPEQLVMLAGRGKHYGGNNGPDRLSYPMYQEIRDKNQVFSGMFCTYPSTVSASFQGATELIGADFVSGNYFPVLGIGAAAGRVFTASDDLIQGGHPLAVLSYGYWRARFGADPGIVGKQIVVNGRSLTIIGVSPAGFDGVEPGRAPQIRIPITMKDDLPRSDFGRLNTNRFRWAEVFGRLKPGMTLEKAQAGLQPLFHQILNREVTEKPFAKASPFVKQEFLKMWMEAMPGSKGRSNLRRDYSKPLFALMGIVGLVLLIACSNLANLLIARASARQKEIAVRLALGAGRGSLIRQLLLESLALAAAGGVSGRRSGGDDRPGVDRLSALRTHSALAIQHAGLDGARFHLRDLADRRGGLRIGSGAAIHAAETRNDLEGPGRRRDPRRLGRIAQGAGGGAGVALLAAADRRRAVPAEPAKPEDAESRLRSQESARLRCRPDDEPLRPQVDRGLLPPPARTVERVPWRGVACLRGGPRAGEQRVGQLGHDRGLLGQAG